jgi:hypothetical protein
MASLSLPAELECDRASLIAYLTKKAAELGARKEEFHANVIGVRYNIRKEFADIRQWMDAMEKHLQKNLLAMQQVKGRVQAF